MKKSLLISLSVWLITLSITAQTENDIANKYLSAIGPEPRNSEALVIIDGEKYNTGIIFLNPKSVKSVTILKDQEAINIYGDEGKNGVILVITEQPNPINNLPFDGLVLIDGEKCTNRLNWFDPVSIKSITVLKNQQAIKVYGEAGNKGALIITTNKQN